MTRDAFVASLSRDRPPPDLAAPLAALWWASQGESGWDRAHALVQNEPSSDGAWVHAHLHRAECDLGNAEYWYRRAGQNPATGPLGEERDAIVSALLAR